MFKYANRWIKVGVLIIVVASLVYIGVNVRPQASSVAPPTSRNAIYYIQNNGTIVAADAITGKEIKSVSCRCSNGMIAKTADKLYVTARDNSFVSVYDTGNASTFLEEVATINKYSKPDGTPINFGKIKSIVAANGYVYLSEVGVDNNSVNIVSLGISAGTATAGLIRTTSGPGIQGLSADDRGNYSYPITVSKSGYVVCYAYVGTDPTSSSLNIDPFRRMQFIDCFSAAGSILPAAGIKLSPATFASKPKADSFKSLAVSDAADKGKGVYSFRLFATDSTNGSLDVFDVTANINPGKTPTYTRKDRLVSSQPNAVEVSGSILYMSTDASPSIWTYDANGDYTAPETSRYQLAASYSSSLDKISIGDNGNVYILNNGHSQIFVDPITHRQGQAIPLLPEVTNQPTDIVYGKAPVSVGACKAPSITYAGIKPNLTVATRSIVNIPIKITNNSPVNAICSNTFDIVVGSPAGWSVTGWSSNVTRSTYGINVTSIDIVRGATVITSVTFTASSSVSPSGGAKVYIKAEADPDPTRKLAAAYQPVYTVNYNATDSGCLAPLVSGNGPIPASVAKGGTLLVPLTVTNNNTALSGCANKYSLGFSTLVGAAWYLGHYNFSQGPSTLSGDIIIPYQTSYPVSATMLAPTSLVNGSKLRFTLSTVPTSSLQFTYDTPAINVVTATASDCPPAKVAFDTTPLTAVAVGGSVTINLAISNPSSSSSCSGSYGELTTLPSGWTITSADLNELYIGAPLTARQVYLWVNDANVSGGTTVHARIMLKAPSTPSTGNVISFALSDIPNAKTRTSLSTSPIAVTGTATPPVACSAATISLSQIISPSVASGGTTNIPLTLTNGNLYGSSCSTSYNLAIGMPNGWMITSAGYPLNPLANQLVYVPFNFFTNGSVTFRAPTTNTQINNATLTFTTSSTLNANLKATYSVHLNVLAAGSVTPNPGTVGGVGCTLPVPGIATAMSSNGNSGTLVYAYSIVVTSQQDTCNHNFNLTPYYNRSPLLPGWTYSINPTSTYNPTLGVNHTSSYTVGINPPAGTPRLSQGDITLVSSP